MTITKRIQRSSRMKLSMTYNTTYYRYNYIHVQTLPYTDCGGFTPNYSLDSVCNTEVEICSNHLHFEEDTGAQYNVPLLDVFSKSSQGNF